MMEVQVFINGRMIASATAINRSNLAKVSDYAVGVAEISGPFTKQVSGDFEITGHDREQTCWALVEKIAEMAKVLSLPAKQCEEGE